MDEHGAFKNKYTLPESMQGLIECIGDAAALRLIEWRGGVYLCVPKKCDPAHPLFQIIGAEAFAKLVDWYAGEKIMLPREAVMRQLRYAQIKELRYQQNMAVADIALKVGYSMRWVFQVLAEDDAANTDAEIDSRPLNGELF